MINIRLPNGYGQITKLSGKRRNPYAAYPPSKRRDPRTGHFIKEKAIGYYHTKKEAMDALFAFHHNPSILNTKSTYKEIFNAWISEKEKDNLSEKTIYAYKSFYRHLSSYEDVIYSDLRIPDFQGIIDDSGLSWSSQNTLRSMIKQIGVFALKNDYVVKDYASFTKVRKENDQIKGIPFTEDEIRLLWNKCHVRGVKEALIMIYSGLRIGELETATIDKENWLFVGGLKTDAGKNRTVPIHPKIRPLIEEFDQSSFEQIHFRQRYFNPIMEKLGIRFVGDVPHTPHDCRHTFSWLADKYKIDKLTKHLLMGHSPKGVEDLVYGHRTVDELRSAIEQIEM